jgi:hypothetical protein
MIVRPAIGMALAVLVATACHPPAPQVAPVSHLGAAIPLGSAAELLERVRVVNDGYGTLRTLHNVTVEIALGGDRSEKRSFRAALAIRRPGHFRLTILGPLGLKLIDLLYAAGKTRVLHVEPALQRSSRLPEIVDSIAADIAAMYRLDPQLYASRSRMEETIALASGRAPLYDLKEYRGEEIVRQMTIFAATLAISRMEVIGPHNDIRTITYGDYESRGKLLVPRSFLVAKEGDVFYWLSIQVEQVDVDLKLDDHLFIEK